ncbi:uncharacterized protein [Littorina saxatilis]|uniref:EF-hand domain-containing protein n=1 Tax=Littorina saxatilis TaxID=31220 RepID=A0AAN9GGK2_9CAEN
MMSKTLLVLLVICAMFVPDCEGWRRRRRFWRKVKNAAVAAVVGGKRDADCGPDLTPEQLEESCSGLGVDASLGLDRAYVETSFATSDANGDGSLTEDELDEFVTAIEALDECEDFELNTKK